MECKISRHPPKKGQGCALIGQNRFWGCPRTCDRWSTVLVNAGSLARCSLADPEVSQKEAIRRFSTAARARETPHKPQATRPVSRPMPVCRCFVF
jgi:hypothetical protein